MSLQEAKSQYLYANKLAKAYYRHTTSKKKNPFLLALDEIVNSDGLYQKNIGIIDIPTSLIVGTKTTARKMSFAGNFMPLLDDKNEFSNKWQLLCSYHLSDTGITEPIKAYEYLGKFYVLEGNKRVSVLKSYGAPYISGEVIRLYPDKYNEVYESFVNFYELSKMYDIQFTKADYYYKFQKALGLDYDHVWSKRRKALVVGLYYRFVEILKKKTSDENYADYFYKWLKIMPFDEVNFLSDSKLKANIENYLPSILFGVAINPKDLKMKILCLSDEENPYFYEFYHKDMFKDYDLILSAGDLKTNYLEFIVTMSNKKLIYVYGNHDIDSIAGGICAEDDLIIVNGIRILGLGGSIRYSGIKNQYSELQMKWRIFKLLPKIKKAGGIDIILSHVPLRGYGDMQDLPHHGFECFKYLLDKYEPKYLIHGHIHMNYGNDIKRVVTYKNTKIINAYKSYDLDY